MLHAPNVVQIIQCEALMFRFQFYFKVFPMFHCFNAYGTFFSAFTRFIVEGHDYGLEQTLSVLGRLLLTQPFFILRKLSTTIEKFSFSSSVFILDVACDVLNGCETNVVFHFKVLGLI